MQPRDLPLLAVFAAVVRHRSFTAAARELGLSKSVVSDHVRTLEDRCGVRLLERTTRQLRLTQVGEEVLRAATSVVDATREIDAILEEHREAAVGTLRVATTHDLGVRLVAPVAARLAAQHSQLTLDIVSDDEPQDLIGGRFDLGVRLGAPRDSGYMLRKLGSFAEHIVASPSVLEAFGSIGRPCDLAGAPWVRHGLISRGDVWRFRGPRGEVDEIAVSVRAQANTGDSVRALLLGGAGFGVLPEYQIASEIRRGALVKVCPEWIWRTVTLYALVPSAKRAPKRVGLFLSAMKEALTSAGLASQDP